MKGRTVTYLKTFPVPTCGRSHGGEGAHRPGRAGLTDRVHLPAKAPRITENRHPAVAPIASLGTGWVTHHVEDGLAVDPPAAQRIGGVGVPLQRPVPANLYCKGA